MRHVFVRVLGILTLAIVALLPVNARASRPRPPSEPEAMALQGPLGVARYSGLPMDAPSPWWSQAAGVAAGPSEFEPSALGLGPLPSTQRREAGTFDPLQGIALVDVDRIRGPPGLQLENRTWTLQILGQSVVVVAQGVSTRLVWSCGGPGFDAVRYDCARSEYEGSASFRKLQSLWHVLEYDEQTRPCYAKYRWYDPETGSFVSADPLGFPDSMNQYAWGVGNYWKADPLGLMEPVTRRKLLNQRRAAIEKCEETGCIGPLPTEAEWRAADLMQEAWFENNSIAQRGLIPKIVSDEVAILGPGFKRPGAIQPARLPALARPPVRLPEPPLRSTPRTDEPIRAQGPFEVPPPATDRPIPRVRFENLQPSDKPSPIRRSTLEFRGGRWVEISSTGQVRTPSGSYNFVSQGGKTFISRVAGHVDLAQGKTVEFAGNVRFSGGERRGEMAEWSNASGHYRPSPEYAAQAGLPMDKFKPEAFGTSPQAGKPASRGVDE